MKLQNTPYHVLAVSLVFVLCVAGCNSTRSAYTSKTYKRSSVTKRPSTSTSTTPSTGVKFSSYSYLDDALEAAKRDGKQVFVDFYIDRCPPCKLMDEEVFTNRQLASYMNEHFISLKINAGHTQGANLAQLYSVGAYPTLLFLDAEGQIIVRKDGGTSTQHMLDMANRARRSYAAR